MSDTFCRVETDNLSVPCLQALRKDARLSLVYCHGNAMSIRELTERVKQISMDLQCNVFIPEIPGVLFCSMDTCLDHPVQSVGRELCGGGGGRVRHGGGALSGAAGGDLGPVAGHGRGVRAGRATPSRLRSRAAEPAALLSQGRSLLVSKKPTLSQVLQVASLSLPSLWGADLFVSWKRAPHIAMPSLVMHGARDEVRFVSFDLSPCF